MSESSNYGQMDKRTTCYFCSAFGNIEEHHIIPQRFGGPDTPDNIVGLCGNCHGKLETLYDKTFFEWFGIDDESGRRKYHRTCERSDCTDPAEVHWRNTRIATEFFTCAEHCTRPWDDSDRFEVVEEWTEEGVSEAP